MAGKGSAAALPHRKYRKFRFPGGTAAKLTRAGARLWEAQTGFFAPHDQSLKSSFTERTPWLGSSDVESEAPREAPNRMPQNGHSGQSAPKRTSPWILLARLAHVVEKATSLVYRTRLKRSVDMNLALL